MPTTATAPPARNVKLSFREKAGYSLGDAAANFVFQTILVFQLAFYTDTFGITAAAAGTLFLVVRISDAFTDPMMGLIADRTDTPWGKFRPWILWSAVPFAVLAVLTFTTPDLGPTGKLWWAYLTYGLLMVVYTVNNLPYSALSGVMTGDPDERTSLSTYRFVAAMLGAMVVQGLALPLVDFFGQGDDQRGYQLTVAAFGLVAVAFFVVTFLTTKERVRPDPGQRSTVREDLGDLARNKPWLAMFALALTTFVALSMRGSVAYFYFEYYLDVDDVSRAFSVFNVYSICLLLVGIVAARPLAARFGKRDVFRAGIVGTVAFTAAYVFLPPDAPVVLYVVEGFRQLLWGFTVPLLWAMMGDVADFSEWKTGRRATGMVFSGVVFALKAGLGFGGAIAGWALATYGYQANVEQTAEALTGIVMLMSVYPAVGFALGAVCLLFYSIDREGEREIAAALALRREQAEAAPVAAAP